MRKVNRVYKYVLRAKFLSPSERFLGPFPLEEQTSPAVQGFDGYIALLPTSSSPLSNDLVNNLCYRHIEAEDLLLGAQSPFLTPVQSHLG